MNGTASEVLVFDESSHIELRPIETTPAGVYEGTLVVRCLSVESFTPAGFTFQVTVISQFWDFIPTYTYVVGSGLKQK